MASIFWMLVTWCLWFLPDILPPLDSETQCNPAATPPESNRPCLVLYVLQMLFPFIPRMRFALTFDLPPSTWPKRHGPGAFRPQRYGSALLSPAHLQNRPGLHQGDGGGEEDGEDPRGTRSREQPLALVQYTSSVCLFVCQNVLVLAEAGCLDPRIFCTSCMVSLSVVEGRSGATFPSWLL